MTQADIAAKFSAKFGKTSRIFRAPGRVNLIGEHTDYNDGFVFPMALGFYTTIAVAPRDDRNLVIWSEDMQESVKGSLNDNKEKRSKWSDYINGVARMLELQGYVLPGADLFISSDVPVGSGLSSSAALEISSALALLSTIDAEMDSVQLAKLAQRAENHFVGMNCGIMDQFISVHGREGHALFLDCRSLAFQHVPLPAESVRIVICNTMVKHELGASEYNNRRAECEKGVQILSSFLPGIKALRDVKMQQFRKLSGELSPVVRKRCKHVISENQRTEDSIKTLQNGDTTSFGRLMNQSHESLRDDYEVSCRELDIMVELALKAGGVLGARMTGGGFGGCTVNLVDIQHVDKFCGYITQNYQQQTGIVPQTYISDACNGAHEV